MRIDADVKLSANPRAAALLDGVPTTGGIIIIGGTIAAGASGLKVVVQNSADSSVQIDAANKSTTTTPLGVSAPQIAVPAVLP